MDNIIALHKELRNKTYRHGDYLAFKINDSKPRDIHKASVCDRLLHHAIYRILYPYFDRKFIFDSYSCRKDKGTHKALNRFRKLAMKVSRNNTKTTWVLKGDISKFFANIDHQILKSILGQYIRDEDILWLFGEVIDSFQAKGKNSIGLPLGNLTSQLLVNIYMNEFDEFIKRNLKVKYYMRYADDFIVLGGSRLYLVNLIPLISDFLEKRLGLSLNPNKLSIKTYSSGVDFLGWVHFPGFRVLRTATKKRIFRRLKQNQASTTLTSYLGLLKHGNTYGITKSLLEKTLKKV